MLLVVFDTNVFVSALIAPSSPPGQLIALWREGVFMLCVSDHTLAELRRVTAYSKVERFLKASQADITRLVDELRTRAIYLVQVPQIELTSVDPDDDHFLALSNCANADYLVSGDHHLLTIGEVGDTRILSPSEFLNALLPGPE